MNNILRMLHRVKPTNCVTFTGRTSGNLDWNRKHRSHHGLIVKSSQTRESRLGKKGREKIILCAGCGFHRGDFVSIPGLERASTRSYSLCQLKPMQSQHFQGVTTITLHWDSALRVKLFVDIGVRIRKEGGEPVVRLCVRGSRPPV